MSGSTRFPAEAIRAACIDAALLAYEDAGIRGLCEEGRWECAIAAMRQLDVRAIAAASGAPATIADVVDEASNDSFVPK
jgi:hypothetical protein